MLRNFKTKLKRVAHALIDWFTHTETIDESRAKWDTLARKNARYFVLTDRGEEISEQEFATAGQRDYQLWIGNDTVLQEKLKPWSEKAVLEIGCGIGRITEFLGGGFKQVTGIDISKEMIARGQERLKEKRNIVLIPTDGVRYPFLADTFDFIFSVIVFQHMPTVTVVKKNMKEVGRTLKVSGIAKIQLRGIPTKKTNWFYGPSFTREDLPALVEGSGLSVLKTEGAGTKYFWIWLEKHS